MNIQEQAVGNNVVLHVSGGHTHRDVGTLRSLVDQALHRGVRSVVLDLRGVNDIGATGLGELVGIYGAVQRAAGRIALTAVPGRVRHLLAASGLDVLLTGASVLHGVNRRRASASAAPLDPQRVRARISSRGLITDGSQEGFPEVLGLPRADTLHSQ